jgi:ribosomal protein L14E/L6E/L27E
VLEDEEFAFIADGRLRKVEKPKRKRKKHLAPTKTVLEKDALETNGKLITALSKFNKIDEGGN